MSWRYRTISDSQLTVNPGPITEVAGIAGRVIADGPKNGTSGSTSDAVHPASTRPDGFGQLLRRRRRARRSAPRGPRDHDVPAGTLRGQIRGRGTGERDGAE